MKKYSINQGKSLELKLNKRLLGAYMLLWQLVQNLVVLRICGVPFKFWHAAIPFIALGIVTIIYILLLVILISILAIQHMYQANNFFKKYWRDK
jgi:hypothetical protein